MQYDEFSLWLTRQGMISSSISTRLSDACRVEANYGDLDRAFDRDRLDTILDVLSYSAADEAASRPNPSLLAIDGNLKTSLASYRAAVAAYVRFRSENAEVSAGNWAERELRHRYHGPLTDTAKMLGFHLTDGRAVALQRDVSGVQIWFEDDPDRGMAPVDTVRHYRADQARHSNLPARLKHVPPAGAGPRRVAVATIDTPHRLAAVLNWYEGPMIDRDALERLRAVFIEKFPNFCSFEQAGSYEDAENGYKRALIARASTIVENMGRDAAGALIDLLTNRTELESNLLGWRMTAGLARIRTAHPGVLEGATARLIAARNIVDGVDDFVCETWPILSEGQEASQPYGDSRTIPTMLAALIRPDDMIAIRYQPFHNAGVALIGRSLFANAPLSRAEVSDVLAMARAILAVMRDDWDWAPRDLWDVQGFIWATSQKRRDIASAPQISSDQAKTMTQPTNLILYGPPGTGKTYATAEHAVRLCGETPPADRTELMARYAALSEVGRIEFVTFHQSMAYEDFVEGLRPETGALLANPESDVESDSGGFRLRPRDGIFKQISERARLTNAGTPRHLDRKRDVFKIALGRRGREEHQVAEGLDRGLIHLGWGGEIDWSDEMFDSFQAIKRHWQTQVDADATGKDPNIEMIYTLRGAMQPGDYVILSDGRDLGQVSGEYFYDAGAAFHPHRRPVRWLWQDAAGVPRDCFYPRQFRQHSTYQLSSDAIDWDALDMLIFGQDAVATSDAPAHVLVIDEINRANISKVFGELITLLEADKRIGKANALRVRLPYSNDSFGVPANLHIIGTMNTADRSIALIDKALRRRFTFTEMMPDYAVEGMEAEVGGVSLAAILETINNRIEYLLDREHQIGHGWLLGCDTKAALDDVMRTKIIPLIAEYFFEDRGRTAEVLGGRANNPFLDTKTLQPPPGMTGEEPRIRWSVKPVFDNDAYARLIAG
jgi:5-methylcytosine-specific restriction protein B